MFDLRLDMPEPVWICSVWGLDMSDHQKLHVAEK
jgi:hypothetical protein